MFSMPNKNELAQKIKSFKKYIYIIIGSVIYSLGVSGFLNPNLLAPGGITGISIILGELLKIETGTLILILNVPLLLLGFWKFGFRFLTSTVVSIALISVMTNIFATLGSFTKDLFLAAVWGSVCTALGVGMVLKAGATTGGTDIIVRILRKKIPHLKTGFLYLCTDILVVLASGFAFGQWERAMYAAVTVFLTSQVLDLVLYGRDEAKMLIIISGRAEQIAERLMAEIEVGVTYLQGEGAFSYKEKKVILCVVKKTKAPKAEEIIKEEDRESFMIVATAKEVYGEGYKSLFAVKY